MKSYFYILCHERELSRPSSSAKVVSLSLSPNCQLIPWHRTQPADLLTRGLSETNTALLYPTLDASEQALPEHISNFVLLDGTWQETRKIYNHSPYLNRFPSFRLNTRQASHYHLRRNQIAGGLCTAEVVMEILKLKHEQSMLEKLTQEFKHFQQRLMKLPPSNRHSYG